jgi:hypothetical protein
MIGIAGREWQVNQKASKLRIYTLKTQMGNNFDYFNIYCRWIFDSLSIFTSITFFGVPSYPALPSSFLKHKRLLSAARWHENARPHKRAVMLAVK